MFRKNKQNAKILCDFIMSEIDNQNIKVSTKLTHLKIICWLSKYLNNKEFQSVTRDEVADYLSSLRKTELIDPTHRWIGTYNTRQMILNKFFRWFYNKNEFDTRKWITPNCMQGIRQLSRKEKSPYRPSDSHPMGNNPEAFLFISLADSNYGQQLSENALYKLYTRTYRKTYFQKLIDDSSSIPELDKSMIKNLILKSWNPYVLRHSALTAKSQILKESTLRDHAGWTPNSKMPNVYIHYFGNESSKSLLEAYGI